LFLGPVTAVLAASGVQWWWDRRRRARRELARAPEKPLGAVVAGERVRVRGEAQRAEAGLVGRFSGRKCIAFRATVEENRGTGWWEVFKMERYQPFVLVAEGVEARVEGMFHFELQIDHRIPGDPPREVVDLLGTYGFSLTDAFGRPRRLRYLEAALEDGDSIWMLGRARVVVDPGGQRESLRSQPMLRVFEGTFDEPVILADVEPLQRQAGASDT
jgi:hypothetical protein